MKHGQLCHLPCNKLLLYEDLFLKKKNILKLDKQHKRMIGKSLIGIYDNRLRSSTDRQKSSFKIWQLIGTSLDRRLRDRHKSKGKSLIGVSLIGKYLETLKISHLSLLLFMSSFPKASLFFEKQTDFVSFIMRLALARFKV